MASRTLSDVQLQFPIVIDTLKDAQTKVLQNMDTGSSCPCCHQWVRRYRYALNEKNVYFLIQLRRYLHENSKEYVHIDHLAEYACEAMKGGTSFSILAWWGLIEEMPNTDDHKKTSGFWRPTQKGMDWLDGLVKIPQYVYCYNKTITMALTDKMISVKEIPWNKFRYDVLMTWRGNAVW